MESFFDARRWAPFLEPAIWQFVWTGLQITLAMAGIAIAGNLALGLLLAVCRLSRLPVLRYPAIVFVEAVRALPVLLLIFFVFFGASRAGWGLSPFGAGTLALTLYTGAINAEIMRAGITSIGRGQWEAARSLGLTYGQALTYVVLPQAARRMVPPQVSQIITLIKDTSLAAVIGVGELTRRGQLIYQADLNPLQSLFVCACIYFAINYSLSLFSRRWEVGVAGGGTGMGRRVQPAGPIGPVAGGPSAA